MSSGRWLTIPIVFLFIVLLTFNNSNFERKTSPFPRFFPFTSRNYTKKLETNPIATFIPLNGVTQAFEAGRLYQTWIDEKDTKNSTRQKLERLIGTKGLEIEHGFKLYDSSQTNLQKAAGFMTFANFLFVCASFVVLCALIPVLSIFVKPFITLIVPALALILEKLTPLYEPLVYSLSFFFVSQSVYYHENTSYLIAFFGGSFGLFSIIYSASLHAPRSGNNEELFVTFIGFYCAILFGIIAIFYQSSFLGFISVAGLFNGLGFSIVPYGLSIVFGHRSDDILERITLLTGIVMVGSLLMEVNKTLIERSEMYTYINPFRFGIFVIGGVVHFSSGLIMVCKWSFSYYNRRDGIRDQAYFVISLLLFLYFGTLYHIQSLTNTAIAFFVLYLMTKYAELCFNNNDNFWILSFFGGLCGIWISMWLKSHPDFVIQMFHFE